MEEITNDVTMTATRLQVPRLHHRHMTLDMAPLQGERVIPVVVAGGEVEEIHTVQEEGVATLHREVELQLVEGVVLVAIATPHLHRQQEEAVEDAIQVGVVNQV